jgi:hypothetical protein
LALRTAGSDGRTIGSCDEPKALKRLPGICPKGTGE